MENIKHLIAVGYQLGQSKEEDDIILRVEFDGICYPLNVEEYLTWIFCLEGKTYEEAYQDFITEYPESNMDFKACLEELIKVGLVIEVMVSEESIEGEMFWELCPIRQGVGVGYVEETDNYGIKFGETRYLNKLAYLIWGMCDGKTSIKAMMEMAEEDQKLSCIEKWNLIEMFIEMYNQSYIILTK